MPVAGSMRAAKGSRVSVGGTPLTKSEWDVTYRGDDLDTTNFESGGVEQGLIGVLGADWNAGGDWDAARPAFGVIPGMYPREDLANLQLYTNVSDGHAWAFPLARVISARNGAQVRQKVTLSGSGKGQGNFSLPGV